MSASLNEQYAQDWQALFDPYPDQSLQVLGQLAVKWQRVLADHFYERLLQDAEAAHLISHDQVRTRLHASLCRWLVSVLTAGPQDDLQPLVALQQQVGAVHARIGVPMHLVLRGTRNLKDKFSQLLCDSDLDVLQQRQCEHLLQQVLDLAMEIMSQAYASSHDRSSRAQEAYRLFAVVENVATERQRQRAALLDWENRMMFELALGSNVTEQYPRLGASEFGLWFRHKGAHAFQATEEARLILASIDHIDRVLLPACVQASGPDRLAELRALRDEAQSIAFRLDVLFRQTNELEAGRDVLTRLLNRKFLPTVLSKEIAHARQHKTPFAVLAIDVDNFKGINDTYGHSAGDMVLQQLATVLVNNCRAGDYIFRLGGEEFFMLLVDVDLPDAQQAAEKLRHSVAEEAFRLSDKQSLRITISLGLAMHNGHPDHQLLMRRADQALYQAKDEGRNRVVLAAD